MARLRCAQANPERAPRRGQQATLLPSAVPVSFGSQTSDWIKNSRRARRKPEQISDRGRSPADKILQPARRFRRAAPTRLRVIDIHLARKGHTLVDPESELRRARAIHSEKASPAKC